ncbi:hypothetical protein V5N11_005748 [Cardamine amara subsp. amara]|uniref:NYN domain-containing protein n=1 Tax=Cardamine amara subsp. amara TaxID=228776 RepID=A0ABD1C4K2_CARAN
MDINDTDTDTKLRNWHSKRYGRAMTAVFWDVVDCQIPNGSNAVEVSQNIRSALKKIEYCGRASIYAYGNPEQIVAGLDSAAVVVSHLVPGEEYNASDPKYMDYRGTASIYADDTQVKCESPAIVVNHSPADKYARLQKILVNMFTWALDHHSPANLMLILGDITELDDGFISALNRFRMKNYNVVFAQPANKSPPLHFPVSTKYIWENLSVGDILTVQTKPVDDNTFGGIRRSPTRLFLLAGALLCIAAFARLRLPSPN